MGAVGRPRWWPGRKRERKSDVGRGPRSPESGGTGARRRGSECERREVEAVEEAEGAEEVERSRGERERE